MNTYLKTIENENTRKSVAVLCRHLEEYCKAKNKTISTLDRENIDDFLKTYYSNVSKSSLYTRISALKNILSYFNNEKSFSHLGKQYIKNNFNPNDDRLYTPYEIVNYIETLINAQDRCIVLLCYLGLYDANFETIRNLKSSDLVGNKLKLPNGEYMLLNSYCVNIIRQAIEETKYTPYTPNSLGRYEEKPLYEYTDNIIKCIKSSRASEIVSAIFLKKRFSAFASYLEESNFTPVAVKNSKTVYDFVSKEFFENNKSEINQLVLIDYCKENKIVGCVEKINSVKKVLRDSIIKEIEEDLDFICR